MYYLSTCQDLAQYLTLDSINIHPVINYYSTGPQIKSFELNLTSLLLCKGSTCSLLLAPGKAFFAFDVVIMKR